MKDKKAQNITITTIVIIVLALIVLVILVLGFTSGWSNLWGRITSIFSSGANVDSIVQACQVACSTESKYDYCTRERTIKAESETFVVNDKGELLPSGTAAYNKATFDAAKKAYEDAKKAYEQDKSDTNKNLLNETETVYVMLATETKSKEAIATCKQLADLHSSLGFQSCSVDCA